MRLESIKFSNLMTEKRIADFLGHTSLVRMKLIKWLAEFIAKNSGAQSLERPSFFLYKISNYRKSVFGMTMVLGFTSTTLL